MSVLIMDAVISKKLLFGGDMQNVYQNFTKKKAKQLTKWMGLDELQKYTELFHKYYGNDCYGREYLIKSNRKKIRPHFAIFIRRENKLRRTQDKLLKEKLGIADLLLAVLPQKEEGISLLKTLGKSL